MTWMGLIVGICGGVGMFLPGTLNDNLGLAAPGLILMVLSLHPLHIAQLCGWQLLAPGMFIAAWLWFCRSTHAVWSKVCTILLVVAEAAAQECCFCRKIQCAHYEEEEVFDERTFGEAQHEHAELVERLQQEAEESKGSRRIRFEVHTNTQLPVRVEAIPATSGTVLATALGLVAGETIRIADCQLDLSVSLDSQGVLNGTILATDAVSVVSMYWSQEKEVDVEIPSNAEAQLHRLVAPKPSSYNRIDRLLVCCRWEDSDSDDEPSDEDMEAQL